MMKNIFIIAALYTLNLPLYGCATPTYKRLDMGDIGLITCETSFEMTNCMERGNVKSCTRATELLEEHPWQYTGNLKGFWVDNTSGLLQEEWDLEVLTIKKNIRKIRKMRAHFVVDAYYYSNQKTTQ